ncbi:hypothetical protein BT93_J0294 [Corymbia citriodora subsp. variegata]|nr:hypothetical protein BT93_J0294 [Corymbia citriodora subsp. variegata]
MMREMMRQMGEPAEAPPAAMAQLINDRVWRRVDVGRVRLLSLSPDSSILAACVGGTVNFFSIDELVEMEEFGRPFRSRTIDGGSSVKDMRWLNEHSYILLASCGNLYLGSTDGSLRFLMDNVDAVDCSPNFDKIAAARNDRLNILSSNLNEEYHITLSLHPWTQNFDDPRVKVDSLKWIYTNRIILGCSQLTPDGMEESYCLLVTSPTGGGILRFDDVFPGIVEDIMPAGSGPHLFFSCLENK